MTKFMKQDLYRAVGSIIRNIFKTQTRNILQSILLQIDVLIFTSLVLCVVCRCANIVKYSQIYFADIYINNSLRGYIFYKKYSSLLDIPAADINHYYKQPIKEQFMTSIILLHVSAPRCHLHGL